MRAFLALEIPDHVAGVLDGIQSELRIGREVPFENFHITLAFLGEQPESDVHALHDILTEGALPAAQIAFNELSCMGGAVPRVLCADVHATDALRTLATSVRRSVSLAGFDVPRRRFRPHVTLKRFGRHISPEQIQQIAGFLQQVGGYPLPSFEPQRLVLFESTLHPDGAQYDALAAYPLVAAGDGACETAT